MKHLPSNRVSPSQSQHFLSFSCLLLQNMLAVPIICQFSPLLCLAYLSIPSLFLTISIFLHIARFHTALLHLLLALIHSLFNIFCSVSTLFIYSLTINLAVSPHPHSFPLIPNTTTNVTLFPVLLSNTRLLASHTSLSFSFLPAHTSHTSPLIPPILSLCLSHHLCLPFPLIPIILQSGPCSSSHPILSFFLIPSVSSLSSLPIIPVPFSLHPFPLIPILLSLSFPSFFLPSPFPLSQCVFPFHPPPLPCIPLFLSPHPSFPLTPPSVHPRLPPLPNARVF